MIVHNIKGYWNKGNSYKFNEENSWEGQFILYEDGWFEGIVNDFSSPYVEDRFIYGALIPDKKIELLKITPSEVSKLFIFRGEATESGYEGNFSVIGLFGESVYGVNYIETKLSKEQNIEQLQSRINVWKKSMVGDLNSYLYENSVDMRSQYLQIFKRNQEENPFTKEEISEIAKVTDSIAEKVLGQTVDEVMKLTLTHPFDIENDENLPF